MSTGLRAAFVGLGGTFTPAREGMGMGGFAAPAPGFRFGNLGC